MIEMQEKPNEVLQDGRSQALNTVPVLMRDFFPHSPPWCILPLKLQGRQRLHMAWHCCFIGALSQRVEPRATLPTSCCVSPKYCNTMIAHGSIHTHSSQPHHLVPTGALSPCNMLPLLSTLPQHAVKVFHVTMSRREGYLHRRVPVRTPPPGKSWSPRICPRLRQPWDMCIG